MASTKSLTIVVGAGASTDFNLPVGSELKKKISSLLDIRFEHGIRQKTGDYLIMEAIRLKANNTSHGANDYLHAGWQIRDALPLAPSIDQYINTQRGNELIETCGKLAIVRAILDAERNSALHIDHRSGAENFNIANTANTWIGCLLRMIVDGCVAEELDDRFRSITLIVFNYDRCIEHYLYHALQIYYKVPKQRAAELVSRIRVLHPYGSVGELPWQNSSHHVGYGAEPNPHQLVELASQIKTFTEGTNPNDSDMVQIRAALSMAPRVLFLGFAFHPLNLELIRPHSELFEHSGAPENRRIFATAIGLSKYDCDQILVDLVVMLNCDADSIHLRNDLTASEIFSEYTRGLSFQSIAV